MRTCTDCIPCFVRQAVDASRIATDDDETRERILRETLSLLADASFDCSPPELSREMHERIRRLSGNPDPYLDRKTEFNARAREMLPDLRKRVETSDDPFATAVRLAVAGNIIDFGIGELLADPPDLLDTVEHALEAAVDDAAVEALRAALADAATVLYVGDNTGEVVFDRILVEALPVETVIFATRGGPVINDITSEDARFAGIDTVARVIDNGFDAPGAPPARCSEEFRRILFDADVVIAKGQGNYETLDDCGRDNVFFLLKAKCAVVAGALGVAVGDVVVRRADVPAPEEA